LKKSIHLLEKESWLELEDDILFLDENEKREICWCAKVMVKRKTLMC
jgi:hypothetical protein